MSSTPRTDALEAGGFFPHEAVALAFDLESKLAAADARLAAVAAAVPEITALATLRGCRCAGCTERRNTIAALLGTAEDTA